MNSEGWLDIIRAMLETALAMSAVIAVLLLLTPLLGRRYAAKWRYFIWIAVALRLLIPLNFTLPKAARIEAPLIEVPYAVNDAETPGIATQERSEVSHSAGGAQSGPQHGAEASGREYARDGQAALTAKPARENSAKTLPLHYLLGFVWLGGAGAAAIWRVLALVWWRRRVRRWSSPAEEREQELLEKLRAQLGIRRPVRLLRCAAASGPLSTGIFRPEVLLPEGFIYDEAALGHILRHELTHIKRCDLGYKLLFAVACTLHWWNPLVWLMAREAELDAELACDDEATAGFDRTLRTGYAETLLECAGRPRPGEAAFTTHFRSGAKALRRRLGNLFGRCARRRGALLLAVVIVAAAVSAGFIACGIKDGVNKNAALLRQIERAAGERVASSVCADFDGDGEDEAFAVTRAGELWYASAEGVSRPAWDGMAADVTEYDYGAPELLKLKEPVARLELGGDGGRTLLFGAKDGGAYELDGYPRVRALTDNGGGEFTGLDVGGLTYWFRYDYESGSFYEYGAQELDRERLLALENAGLLLDSLPEDAAVSEILCRANGIVNINYSSGGEKRHMTLRLRDWALSDATQEYGGTSGEYAPRLSEELALVPDGFNPVLRLGDPAYPEWFAFKASAEEVPETYYQARRIDEDYVLNDADWLRSTELLAGLELTFAGGNIEKAPLGCAPFELTVRLREESVVYRFEDGLVTYFDGQSPEGQRCAVGNPDAMKRFMRYTELAAPDAVTLGEAEKLTRGDIVSVEYINGHSGADEYICTLSGEAADRALEKLLGQLVRPARDGDNPSTGGNTQYRLTLRDGSVRELVYAGVVYVDGERRYAGYDWDRMIDNEMRARADGSVETLPMELQSCFIYTRSHDRAEGLRLEEEFSTPGVVGFERIAGLDGLRDYYERCKDIFDFGEDWYCSDGECGSFARFIQLFDESFFDDSFYAALILGSDGVNSYFVPEQLKRFDSYIGLLVNEYLREYGGKPGEYNLLLLALPREYLDIRLDVVSNTSPEVSGWLYYDGATMTVDDVRALAGRARSGKRISWYELSQYRGRVLGSDSYPPDVYRIDFPVKGGNWLIAWSLSEEIGAYPDRLIYQVYARKKGETDSYYDILSGEAP